MKVKLVHDYTKYNEKLEKGIVGEAKETPEEQKARKGDDNFVKVAFDGITEVDVLWKGLEIIDEKYLAAKAAEKAAYFDKLRTAKNVVKSVGPKEGFKKLNFTYLDAGAEKQIEIDVKAVADEHIAAFANYGISVEQVMLAK